MGFTGQQGEDQNYVAEQFDVGALKVGPGWVQRGLTLLAASGAVNPSQSATYVVTKAGVAALTLAAPIVTTATVAGDDGKEITITSNTANAHTLTATGLFQCGTASVNLATFAAQPGAGLTLVAYQGKWNVIASVGITFS